MSAHAPDERRFHERGDAALGCKVLRPAVARFLAARTENVSEGGALLRVRTIRALEEGEGLAVGVSWRGGAALTTKDLVEATIARAGPLVDGEQEIAVRFAQPQSAASPIVEVATRRQRVA